MLRTEAMREANRRWTKQRAKRRGYVRETDRLGRIREVSGGGVFQVGYTSPPHGTNDGGHFIVRGEGDSWEGAFADADRRDGDRKQAFDCERCSLTSLCEKHGPDCE